MKTTGYLVIEACEDFEQPLGLNTAAHLPPGGILEWTAQARAIFKDRATARSAIRRTEHYRLAYASRNHPEAKFCRIVPVRNVPD